METTLNKIEEARQNIQETLNEREKIGKTKENIKIKLIFDKHQPSKIFNAFPIMEENEKKYYFNVY